MELDKPWIHFPIFHFIFFQASLLHTLMSDFSFYYLAATSSFVAFLYPYSLDLKTDRLFYVFMNACQTFKCLIQ